MTYFQPLVVPWCRGTSGVYLRAGSRTCTTYWNTRRSRSTTPPSHWTVTRPPWSPITANQCLQRSEQEHRPKPSLCLYWSWFLFVCKALKLYGMTTWIFLYIELQICIYLDLIGNTEIFINLRRLDGPQMTYQICLEISDNEIWYKEKIQIFYSQNLNIFLYLIQNSLSKRGQNSVKMAKTTWQSWNT